MSLNNQFISKTSCAYGQTDPGHKDTAPEHNHEAAELMVDLPIHKLGTDATAWTPGESIGRLEPKICSTSITHGWGVVGSRNLGRQRDQATFWLEVSGFCVQAVASEVIATAELQRTHQPDMGTPIQALGHTRGASITGE